MTIAERLARGKRLPTPPNEESSVDAAVLVKPKLQLPRDAVLLGILVLASTASFGLGVLAGRDSGGGEEGRISIEGARELQTAAAGLMATGTELVRPEQKVVLEPEPATPSGGGEYLASKTGTKYYLPWCGSAKRIKEENKVWFSSKAEAEAAGYEPAKNCKGL